jgi:hypothetical protein
LIEGTSVFSHRVPPFLAGRDARGPLQ